MPINKNQSVKTIDLKEFRGYKDSSLSEKKKIKKEVGEFLIDSIEEFLDRGLSPVSGGNYKKLKVDGGLSDLFEEGDLRSNLKVRESGSFISVGIFTDAPVVEKLKAYNHNVGDTLPQRQFIPGDSQSFRPVIKKGIDRIVKKETGKKVSEITGILKFIEDIRKDIPGAN